MTTNLTTYARKALLALAAFVFALALTALTAAPCLAATSTSTNTSTTSTSTSSKYTYILDDYGLLSNSTAAQLEKQAESMASTYGVGTYIAIVSDTGSTSRREYAKSIYTNRSLGVGSDKSGILFLIAVKSREYVTITYGQGVTQFSDYRISAIEDEVSSILHDDDWEKACSTFLDDCQSTLAFYKEKGTAWDSNNDPETSSMNLVIALVIGLVVGIVVMLIVRSTLKGQLKSAQESKDAENYLTEPVNVTKQDAHFLGTTVTRRRIEHNNGGGGGSHVDSGGFGGSSGGRF